MKNEEKNKSICQQIEDICGKICDNYCKWPSQYGWEDEDLEKLWEEHCNDCPLEDLY